MIHRQAGTIGTAPDWWGARGSTGSTDGGQAEMQELKLADMRKQLMTVDQYARCIGDTFARVDAHLKICLNALPAPAGGRSTSWSGLNKPTNLVDEIRRDVRWR